MIDENINIIIYSIGYEDKMIEIKKAYRLNET
jgi:hypothetical protein